MAASSDPWIREYNEASRLADDITTMMSEKGSLPQSGSDAIRYISAMRRKITILGTRLDTLDSLLSKLPALKTMYAYSITWFFLFFYFLNLHALRLKNLFGGVLLNCCDSYHHFSGILRTNKEMHKRQDMLANLRSKAKQMASALNMYNFANRFDIEIIYTSFVHCEYNYQ